MKPVEIQQKHGTLLRNRSMSNKKLVPCYETGGNPTTKKTGPCYETGGYPTKNGGIISKPKDIQQKKMGVVKKLVEIKQKCDPGTTRFEIQ